VIVADPHDLADWQGCGRIVAEGIFGLCDSRHKNPATPAVMLFGHTMRQRGIIEKLAPKAIADLWEGFGELDAILQKGIDICKIHGDIKASPLRHYASAKEWRHVIKSPRQYFLGIVTKMQQRVVAQWLNTVA
jgi:hypothetical protein